MACYRVRPMGAKKKAAAPATAYRGINYQIVRLAATYSAAINEWLFDQIVDHSVSLGRA